jgi:putative membrane protein
VQNRTAKLLLLGYILLFVWAGISPYSRATWYAENIPIVMIAVSLVVLYVRGFVFTPISYALMAVLLYLHTIGGHYTFERVPFGFVTNLFGFHRNHFDRVGHFSVGFYAFAIAEALVRTRAVRSRVVLFLFPIFAIGFVAMSYELIEWWYAVADGGASGAAFLGSQGDVWDAQEDMFADTLGAILLTIIFFVSGRARMHQVQEKAAVVYSQGG